MQINKFVWFGVLHRTALHACYPFLFTMSPKGKLAICGFCKTLRTEWSKADLFILNITSAFTHTSNMPRRGILLKISYVMSRKSLFCNTNYSCWSGTGLHIWSHICTQEEVSIRVLLLSTFVFYRYKETRIFKDFFSEKQQLNISGFIK